MKRLTIALFAGMLLACSAEPNASKSTDENRAVLAPELRELSGEPIWKIVHEESRLSFSAVHNGQEFEGAFGNFDAAIRLDPQNPAEGEIHAIVDMNVFDADDNDRNANLKNPEWFDIANYPRATFTSQDIQNVGENAYEATGDLSIKGTTRPVTLAFILDVDGNVATAMGGFKVLRTDYNVGTGSDFETEDWVGFPVQINIVLKAVK